MKAHKNETISLQAAGSPASVPLKVRAVCPGERERFDRLLGKHHYLGVCPSVGDFLRQVVWRGDQWVALLVWGPSALKLKDRERWIGWTAGMASERLKLVVQNRRYLLLHARGEEPNLASQALAAACRALPDQWQEGFGYQPLIAESFTDPEAYHGTCYKASGWEPVGMSAGYSRHRADYYVANDQPKKLWLKELSPGAREKIRAAPPAPEHAAALVAPAHGVLPLNQAQRQSLLETLRKAPDPRARSPRSPALPTGSSSSSGRRWPCRSRKTPADSTKFPVTASFTTSSPGWTPSPSPRF